MTEALKKVDSAVQGVTETVKKPRQSTAAAAGVFRIEDLGKLVTAPRIWRSFPLTLSTIAAEEKDLRIAPETQKTGWYALYYFANVTISR